MSDLTDADLDALARAAQNRGGLWRDVATLVAEVRRLRAVVAAHPTGEDRGELEGAARPRVSDDDLDYMRRWASMSDPARSGTADYESALAELQERRASDIAAAPPAGHEDEAAAPPGDEYGRAVDRATDDVHVAVAECGDGGEAQRTRQRLCDGWRFVPPAPPAGRTTCTVDHDGHPRPCDGPGCAPPAGHEDEAAVERAVRDLCAVRYFDGTTEGRGANMALDSILVALDVLAAARGPRTPDPAVAPGAETTTDKDAQQDGAHA